MRAELTMPPKGWNSFDAYGWSVTEEEFKKNVDFCDKYLRPFGYNIVTVDFCWSHPGSNSLPNPNIYETGAKLNFDDYGRLIPDPVRFPSSADGNGFKKLADYVHSRNMKFGIHVMRGVPYQAVEADAKIKGTDISLKDTVLENGTKCWWLDHMLPLNKTEAAMAYVQSIIDLYIEWEVDFIKLDDISFPYSNHEIEFYSNAIANSPREIILSLSPGATPVEEWEHVSKYADMWRISPDFWDNWEKLKKNYDIFAEWAEHRVNNKYPDGDMIPFGKLSLRGPMGEERYSGFTYEERKSLMIMWCMNSSPLIIGGTLEGIDSKTMDLLTNPLLLQIDESAVNAKKVFEQDDTLIWTAEDKYNSDLHYLAVFNLSDTRMITRKIHAGDSGYMGMNDKVFNNETEFTVSVRPHGAEVFLLKN